MSYTCRWAGPNQNVLLIELSGNYMMDDAFRELLPLVQTLLDDVPQPVYIILDVSAIWGNTIHGAMRAVPDIAYGPVLNHPNLRLVVGVVGDRGEHAVLLNFLESIGKAVVFRTQEEAFKFIEQDRAQRSSE